MLLGGVTWGLRIGWRHQNQKNAMRVSQAFLGVSSAAASPCLLVLGLGCGKLRSPNTRSQCQLLRKCCDVPSETQVKHQKGRGEDRKCGFGFSPSGINLLEKSHSASPRVTPGKMSLESRRHYQQNNNYTWGHFPGGELFISH